MPRPMSLATLAALVAFAAPPDLGPARAEDGKPRILQAVGFDQNLGARVPLDLSFRDESGATVRLGDYFGEKPVILTLVYYNCPMLCTQVLNGLTRSLRPLSFGIGKEFDVVTVSIDPTEGPALSAAKKRAYIRRYDRAGAERGWHFLTGDEASIGRLARTVGFRFSYDPKAKLYAHAAGIMMLTPEGRVSRYFYGIDYPARDLRLGLIEASERRIGSPIDRALLYCFHYDPSTGRYNFAVIGALRLFGTATALAVATYVITMVRRDRRQGDRAAPPGIWPSRPSVTP